MRNDLKSLYIMGAGGFGREVIWLAETINEDNLTWEIMGFVDDDSSLWDKMLDGYKVYGGLDYLEAMDSDVWCVVAVGNAKIRKGIVDRYSKFAHINYATLISPSAKIGIGSDVGEGSMVCAGNIITVDAVIGRHNIINLDCTVGHDARLADFVTLYPSVNVSGHVHIGNTTEIGTGAFNKCQNITSVSRSSKE